MPARFTGRQDAGRGAVARFYQESGMPGRLDSQCGLVGKLPAQWWTSFGQLGGTAPNVAAFDNGSGATGVEMGR